MVICVCVFLFQGKLVLKDFNIRDNANGSNKPIVKTFPVSVTRNRLEIRFLWTGKGTTTVPVTGTYGPLISAISVEPSMCSSPISSFLSIWIWNAIYAFLVHELLSSNFTSPMISHWVFLIFFYVANWWHYYCLPYLNYSIIIIIISNVPSLIYNLDECCLIVKHILRKSFWTIFIYVLLGLSFFPS